MGSIVIDYKKLGRMLAAERKRRGFSQTQYSRIVERLTGEPMPVTRISYLENGVSYPRAGYHPEFRGQLTYYLQYLYPFAGDHTPQALAVILKECWTMAKK